MGLIGPPSPVSLAEKQNVPFSALLTIHVAGLFCWAIIGIGEPGTCVGRLEQGQLMPKGQVR